MSLFKDKDGFRIKKEEEQGMVGYCTYGFSGRHWAECYKVGSVLKNMTQFRIHLFYTNLDQLVILHIHVDFLSRWCVVTLVLDAICVMTSDFGGKFGRSQNQAS